MQTDPYVVSWDDLFPNGTVAPISSKVFAKAERSTTALLLVNGAASADGLFESQGGVHAEARLLRSTSYARALEAVLRSARGGRSASILVLINRTPCHGEEGCTGKLVRELYDFWQARAAGIAPGAIDFTLACTGVYERLARTGAVDTHDGSYTTNFDLRALVAVGWKLRVLRAGSTLTGAGQLLRQAIPSAEDAVRRGLPPLRKSSIQLGGAYVDRNQTHTTFFSGAERRLLSN